MDNKVTPRHVRHRKRSRLRRSKDFKAFLVRVQAILNATGALITPFTATAASASLTATAHGAVVNQGPYLASNSGGTLPTPLVNNQLYWIVAVPDANTLGLATKPRTAAIVLTAAGTGVNTLTKASSLDAAFALLKEYGARRLKAATDVDQLP